MYVGIVDRRAAWCSCGAAERQDDPVSALEIGSSCTQLISAARIERGMGLDGPSGARKNRQVEMRSAIAVFAP
jgi:hypothetical protein